MALKALRRELFTSEGRLELLRQEVRAAREVVSPNVCRVFDRIELEGRELVSMEYIDGRTLLEVLKERGPLELKKAQEIASQFLAGLEAIHKAGLIHRGIKPENIMLTRAGRVVVMDVGIARQEAEGSGTVSGTARSVSGRSLAGNLTYSSVMTAMSITLPSTHVAAGLGRAVRTTAFVCGRCPTSRGRRCTRCPTAS